MLVQLVASETFENEFSLELVHMNGSTLLTTILIPNNINLLFKYIKCFYSGCLGSYIDEERSEMRCVMRIA